MSFRQGAFIAILWTEERFTMAPLKDQLEGNDYRQRKNNK